SPGGLHPLQRLGIVPSPNSQLDRNALPAEEWPGPARPEMSTATPYLALGPTPDDALARLPDRRRYGSAVGFRAGRLPIRGRRLDRRVGTTLAIMSSPAPLECVGRPDRGSGPRDGESSAGRSDDQPPVRKG